MAIKSRSATGQRAKEMEEFIAIGVYFNTYDNLKKSCDKILLEAVTKLVVIVLGRPMSCLRFDRPAPVKIKKPGIPTLSANCTSLF
jgi:hypothetical protein